MRKNGGRMGRGMRVGEKSKGGRFKEKSKSHECSSYCIDSSTNRRTSAIAYEGFGLDSAERGDGERNEGRRKNR